MQLNLREYEPIPLKEPRYLSLNRFPGRSGLADLLLDRLRESGPSGTHLGEVKLMGMRYDAARGEFRMSHFVGTEWLDKRKGISMLVRPHIVGLDFQQMLMQCFRHPEASKDLDEVLFIRTEDEPIEVDASDFQLEPLLIVFFLNLLQRIVRKGLISDYVVHEESLQGKIKGKIQMSRYVRRGLATGRSDRVSCRFEEHSTNCLENRVLKAALRLVHEVLGRNQDGLGQQASVLNTMYQNCSAAFEHVSDDVTLPDLRMVHVLSVYKDYRAIMPLAKMIIRKQGYLVGQHLASGKQMFPPFAINLSELFRRYAYSLLLEGWGRAAIQYEIPTSGGVLDFIKPDQHLLFHTWYGWEPHAGGEAFACKADGNYDGASGEALDRMCAFARSTKVRALLGESCQGTDYPCILVVPSEPGVSHFPLTSESPSASVLKHPSASASEYLLQSESFPLFPVSDGVNLYKLPLSLPVRQ